MRTLFAQGWGFVERALEMPDELQLIADALFMWFTKPSLK